MEVEWGSEFERVLRRVEKGAKSGDPVARIKYDHLRALLDELAQLSGRPEAESRTFKRVRQARRYELWRVAHPYHPTVAVRIIVWFPSQGRAVLALFAFDKAKLGDIWYDRATRESEANVDQWRRENPEWRGEVNE
jgi:hypothetical protein